MLDGEIPLSAPDLSELECGLVQEVLRSGRLSNGPMIERFERLVSAHTGVRHAVGVSSGTAGLHLVLLAMGIGPGDEVITTPFSFIASSNAILYVGARPVFVDIEPKSLNMDPGYVERAITPKTKAILAVEAFGNPSHMDRYAAIAQRHELLLIEDSCEALGTTHCGRACGAFGRAGVFGFYPNKQITTGEGGMIVTDDTRLADLCRSMRNQGRAVGMPTVKPTAESPATSRAALGAWLHHERLGYNYRMSEIAAAIGVGQMRRLADIIERRQAVAQMYIDRLLDHDQIILPTIAPDSTMSWFVFVVRLVTGWTGEERNRIIAELRAHQIGAGDYFPCIHLQPFYRARFGYHPGDFPIAESVSQRTLALPFSSRTTEREVDLVCQTLSVLLNKEGITRG